MRHFDTSAVIEEKPGHFDHVHLEVSLDVHASTQDNSDETDSSTGDSA